MAKVGTAHIEIKPVLNEEALQGVLEAIEQAVAVGYRRGIETALDGYAKRIGDAGDLTRGEVIDILIGLGHHIEK